MTYPPSGGPMYPGFGGPMPANPATAAMAARRSKKRLTLILSAIVAVLALVVGLGALKLYSDKTGKDLFPTLTLRSADDPGPDPFTPSVALTNRTTPAPTQVTGASEQGVRLVNGTTPGLYAVTGTATCDTAKLGNDLAAHPDAASAWASVIGIRSSDIPWYLNTLTPVVLTADTWVTNHAFRSGNASPFQAVLEAGTPVYVDGAGVPRAVCACGNPLRPPSVAPVGGYRVSGTPWNHYHTQNITRITTNNQYVTNVNNTTTVVNNPAPAPAPNLPLQVLNMVTGILDSVPVGGTLELPAPPADVQLPDPFTSNAAPTFADAEVAQQQGLVPGSTQAAPEVVAAANENGNNPPIVVPGTSGQPETVISSGTDTPQAPAPGESTVPGAPTVPTDATVPTDPALPSLPGAVPPPAESAPATVPTATETTPETTATSTPTSFSGTGDAIGSLTFDSGGTSVTCTLPSTFESTTVSATCSDGTSREFSSSAFASAAVISATGPDQVWTVSTASGESLAVTSATWQTLS